MQHEVRSSHHRGVQRGGALLGGLGVGQFGRGERAAAAHRHAQASRQLADSEVGQPGLRGAERRGAGPQRHGGQEVPINGWRAGSDQLGEGHSHHGFGVGLSHCAGRGDRPHGPAQDERADDHALTGSRVVPDHLSDCTVVHQRRVHIDVGHDHAVLVEAVGAENDAGHLDGVQGPLGCGDGPQKRLRRVLEVECQHVQVALVDRDVSRFADHQARVLRPLQGVVDLY